MKVKVLQMPNNMAGTNIIVYTCLIVPCHTKDEQMYKVFCVGKLANWTREK